ncbi:Ribosomal RNA small subunit methyltransferase I [Chlamydiales bacterium SCGC AB-751-O23]|jgi:16S rRNA (cytidine1402-2'-O)-methyltransferase|nr:Ribosomal RNA small subunit methyltransferase I [Chlamydiales bacterium SCGC AB-751-O23]
MLYIVSTPIGNLSDFSFRAVETLKSVDYILCEDTRHSGVLLRHYEIDKPLVSYHKFSEAKSKHQIINDLKEGQTIALISDAGTPCICDPGQELVALCQQEDLPLTPIPGCCAITAAFASSGFVSNGFCFLGFFPKKGKEQKEKLLQAYYNQVPTIFYETPHRLEKTVEIFEQAFPEREIFLAKEITKKFERFVKATPKKLLEKLQTFPLKGEYLLIVDAQNKLTEDFGMDILEHVAFIEKTFQLETKEAIKSVCLLRGLSKKEVYQKVEDGKQTL